MSTPTQITSRWPGAAALGNIVLGSTLMLAGPLALADDDAQATPGKLTVSASAKVEVAPDKAMLSASLWEKTSSIPVEQANQRDPEAMRDAREALEKRATSLITALEDLGVDSERISAGSLSVSRENTYSNARDRDNRVRLTHTKVKRPVVVTLHDLDRVPAVLDALTEAGVDKLGTVHYALQNRNKAEQGALRKAVKKASAEAGIMAEGLDEKLGSVASVTKQNGQRPRPMAAQPRMMKAAMADSAGSGAAEQTEYRAGLLTVNASVSVTWALKSKNFLDY